MPKIFAIGLEVGARTVQTVGVLALLVVTHEDDTMTLFALVLALIWVGIPRRDLFEKAREILIKRDLFQSLGEWLGQSDGGEQVDRAYKTHLDLEAGGHSQPLNAVAKSQAFGAFWMGLVSMLLQVYLIVVAVQLLLEAVNG